MIRFAFSTVFPVVIATRFADGFGRFGYHTFMESLILAQDERWRRA